MDEDEEIKLMVISYHKYSAEEKNTFWLKHSGKPLSQVTHENDISMQVTSKLVELYDNATSEEKEILWRLYKDQIQLYCDRERWRIKFRRRLEYKANFKAFCPGANDDF